MPAIPYRLVSIRGPEFQRSKLALILVIAAAALRLPLGAIEPAAGQSQSSLAISGQRAATSPGGLVTYTLRVDNLGSAEARVELAGAGRWTARVPEALDIPAGEGREVVVGFEAPADVEDGEVHGLGIEAAVDGEVAAELELAAWIGGRTNALGAAGCRFDLDWSGSVDLADVDRVEARVGTIEGEADYDPNLDFDHSGEVDRGDVETVVDALQPSCPGLIRPADSRALQDAVTIEAVRAHLERFQAIADAQGGNRAARTAGYEASVDYVVGELEAAGYAVTRQEFDIPTFVEAAPPALSRLTPDPMDFAADQIATFGSSGEGVVTASLQAVDLLIPPAGNNSSTSGCEAADFTDFEIGSVALIQRGSCQFSDKVDNALRAGAAAIILFNEGQPDRQGVLQSSAGSMRSLPILGASYGVGEFLAASLALTDTVQVRVEAHGRLVPMPTWNVLAETEGGREDRVIVLGGHLDSVAAGAGINDNGSGTAAILETALQLAELGIEPANKLRFAFWGGEELGLLGSRHYVDDLDETERADILANLNLDMIGSPNFFRGIYDGNGSIGGDAEGGPAGSGEIEQVLAEFFDAKGLAHDPTPFDGRSDYGPFIARGIPAGGLFTGAEGRKSESMAERYGGQAGEPFDPCYHRGCDDIDNVSWEVLDEMADAVAHATYTLAMDDMLPLVSGRIGRLGLGLAAPEPEGLYLPRLER